MKKESYERMILDITEFDAEDIIVTSGEEPTPPNYNPFVDEQAATGENGGTIPFNG